MNMKRLAIIKTVRSDPMTRLLIKPIVFLLVIGLLGCTATRWRVFEPSESATPIPHVRVTLTSGSQFKLYDVIVSRETISGTTKDGKTFAVPMDDVRTILVGDSKISAGRTVGGIVAAAGVVVIVWLAIYSIECSKSSSPGFGLC